ncbi:MAG: 6-phosphofructokinase [Ruminococcaceae bacterium]|nr:6-phosphofructokinase [Oscillospiraceae bacterium]
MLKGNAIVGQSGGPTAAINATLAGVIKGAFEREAIGTIYGALNGVEGILKGTICNLSEIIKGEADLKLLSHTPAAALGSCRLKLPKMDEKPEVYEQIIDFFKAHDIRYFFYIGGNDSMDTVAKLSAYCAQNDYEMRIMGVPKTIDNDVMGTDHTPGYGSAAKYIAASMQEILRDTAVYKVKAVTIVEIMGRDAGWLTCAAALPRLYADVAPDLVYLPEVDFDMDNFMEDVRAALEVHPNVVVAVSEGARMADGTYVGASAQSGVVDAFGHAYLSGTGKALELAVKEKIGCKVRSVELNILQRCASHIASKADLDESIMVGAAAVKAACEGTTGKMMTYVRTSNDPYKVETGSEDIQKIANMVREVPREFINERGNNVTDECLKYIAPLTFGEPDIEYENGLPKHFVIK